MPHFFFFPPHPRKYCPSVGQYLVRRDMLRLADTIRENLPENRRESLPNGKREMRYSSRSRSPPTIRATHSEARFHREKREDHGRRALDERRDFERKHRDERRCDERRDDSRDDRRMAATPSSLEKRRFPEKREPERWTVQMGKHIRVYQRYIGDGIGDPVIEKVKDDPRSKPDALTTREVSQMLEKVKDDPRRKPDAFVAVGGSARNTDSWEPASTFVRPEMRVLVGPKTQVFSKTIRHDDVIVVPEFFCAEDDWSMYYTLVEEMRALQAKGQPGSGWIPWAEGNHLISKNPKGCPTYEKVCARVSEYFKIKPGSQATRFNWYRDSSDWKPFHHDSAAYNPERARDQNITVGVSFGAERELAFLHSKNGSRVYFPQCNGMLFAFGRDVNIKWKHGVNALPEAQHDGKGVIYLFILSQFSVPSLIPY